MSFGGLSVALSALQAQRRAMDVTGQNIANANTVGYTRQRADLQALGPTGVGSMQGAARMTGDGVTVDQVVRLSDSFAAARLRQEESSAGYLSTRHAVLAQIEGRFLEPSDDGISAQLGQLWSSWADVSNNPDDVAARNVLLQQATTVVDQIAAGHESVVAQWDATRDQVGALAQEVNGLAASIAELNGQIRASSQMGAPANELRDTRDQLVLAVSGLVGATARAGSDGTVDLFLGGTALVRGSSAEQLSVVGATEMSGVPATPADPGGSPVALQWASGQPVDVQGGSVQAMLSAVNTDLVRAGAGYDAVAAELASSVNEIHRTGFGLSSGTDPATGLPVPGATGLDFFTGSTAASLAVNADLAPQQIAAAGPVGGFDGSVADAISQLASAEGGPDTTWSSFVVGFGVDVQAAGRRADTAEVVRRDSLSALMSTTGVDIDEEMTNLVQFQRAYEGAARVLTAIDQALDTLINRTGVVGR